jgi:hypothetical protein
MKDFLWSGTDSVQGEMLSGMGMCSTAIAAWWPRYSRSQDLWSGALTTLDVALVH